MKKIKILIKLFIIHLLGSFHILAISASVSSVEIVSKSSSFVNSCSGGGSLVLNTNNNIYVNNSVTFSILPSGVPGFLGYTWAAGQNGPIISNGYSIGSPSSWSPGFNAPAGTLLSARIDTYNGLNLTGSKIYSATIVWNCTTGALVSIMNTDLTLSNSIANVDALSNFMLMFMIFFAGALGMLKLRR